MAYVEEKNDLGARLLSIYLMPGVSEYLHDAGGVCPSEVCSAEDYLGHLLYYFS